MAAPKNPNTEAARAALAAKRGAEKRARDITAARKLLTEEGLTVSDSVEDKRWNTAVDWLLNSRHCADPDIQGPFWDYVDGKIDEEALRDS
jgi:hypothetical protein